MTSEENAALHRKFQLLKGAEQHKNHLIEELLSRLDNMTEQYEQEKLDHARESHFNREVQHREIQLQNQLQQYRSLMDRDAFILVLIDGDGMIFEDDLISKGEAGGKEAAARLWNSVTEYVRRNMSCIPSDYKIVTRVYANLKGLGEVCRKAGIIDISDVIEEFARGFTGSKQLFDFVDVGVGKDRADDKISEIFKLHLYDSHCRQILFGCSHDNGYARLLEDVAEPTICDSITLLEGVPFEKELAQLDSKYRTAKFEGLFRTKKINVYPPISKHSVPLQTLGSPSPQTNSYRGPQSLQGQSIIQNAISRAKSSTPPTNGSALNPHDASWATTAKSAPTLNASPPPTPQPTSKLINEVPRNRYGQRIDPVIQYDPQEVKRIKKLKMCNVHYLRNDCPYDPCTHGHDYKPNKNELMTLRYVSRMTPCHFGSECDDPKCIYGHKCPNDVEGKEDCRWGENCRFEKEMHGIDRTPVRTTKVGKK